MVCKLDMIKKIFIQPLLFFLHKSVKLRCKFVTYCRSALHRNPRINGGSTDLWSW